MTVSIAQQTTDATQTRTPFSLFGLPPIAWALLALTAVISLVWSHYKLMWNDEFLVLMTDNARSLGSVWHIQRFYPVAIDPFFYHALIYAAIKLLGPSAFAMRLPSLISFLVMQACTFVYVRRIATEQAALFALAAPAMVAAFYYSAEARPYGLLLGLFGVAMVSWQTASRSQSHRTGSLVILALAIALSINTHYFGILLVVPIITAEAFRTLHNRRLDLAVLTSIVCGVSAAIFLFPFQKAAAEFRVHYYTEPLDRQAIISAYHYIFFDYAFKTPTGRKLLLLGMFLFVSALTAGVLYQLRKRRLPLRLPDVVLLFALAALPLIGYIFAKLFTHSTSPRFVLGTVPATLALIAIALAPVLRDGRIGRWAVCALFILIAGTGFIRIRAERVKTIQQMAALSVAPEIKAAIAASPTQLLYFQDEHAYLLASYYEPDRELRDHLALVFSREQELRQDHSDTTALTALTAIHMQRFTGYSLVPYESLRTQSGQHLFVLFHDGSNWIDSALAADRAELQALGAADEGDVVSVNFPQPASR